MRGQHGLLRGVEVTENDEERVLRVGVELELGEHLRAQPRPLGAGLLGVVTEGEQRVGVGQVGWFGQVATVVPGDIVAVGDHPG